MAADQWETTEADLESASIGVMIQATAADLDLNNPKIEQFVKNMIAARASLIGENRWLCQLHQKSFENAARENSRRVKELLESLERRFTSANNIPVTRAHITDKEFAMIKTFLKSGGDDE